VVQTVAGAPLWVSFIQAFGLQHRWIGERLADHQAPGASFYCDLRMLVFVQGARLHTPKGSERYGTGNPAADQLPAGGTVPAALLVWLVINVIFIVILRYTRPGVGFMRWRNPSAARYAGIRVDAVVIAVHMICSMLALLAAVVKWLHRVCGFAIGIGLQPELDCGVYYWWDDLHGGRGNLFGPRQVWRCLLCC